MKIYIAIWKDGHCDTMATPFLDKEKAIEFSKYSAKSCCRFPEDYKESEIEGWIFHVQYSCEGDCIWITEHELE